MGDATVVSMLPYDLVCSFPSMIPNAYFIPKVENEGFEILHVSDCNRIQYLGEGRNINVPVYGIQVASSIVNDHIKASYGVSEGAFPPIKAIPGRHEKERIKETFSKELKDLEQVKKNWFGNIVKTADAIWNNSVTGHNPKHISEIQKTAARYLGLNREWVSSVVVTNVQCPVCRVYVDSLAIMCSTCKTVLKPEEYKKFQKVS